ncbi:MAG: helix-turn-helix transcriptional regulator [Lachnospiraceae bacterium]|nr:helix-turn-helix transcriptional regulator [Lachnospiraceae bacterium]
MEFKDKLLYARAVLKISQEQLAKELDVSYATINRWENGNTKPSKMMVIRFEQFCGDQEIIFKQGENHD